MLRGMLCVCAVCAVVLANFFTCCAAAKIHKRKLLVPPTSSEVIQEPQRHASKSSSNGAVSASLSAANNSYAYDWTEVPIFGYKSRRNVLLWRMILSDLESLNFTRESGPCFLDWGSDAGYFSSVSAIHFSGSKVVSFDMHTETQTGKVPLSKRVYGSKTALNTHMAVMQDFNISNNLICDTQFSPETFQALYKSGVSVDVQLTLNILHWMDQIKTPQEFDEMLRTHLKLSLITYVMLPVGPQPKAKNPHRVEGWLNRRTMPDIIKSFGSEFSVELINLPPSAKRYSVAAEFTGRPLYRIVFENEKRPLGMRRAKLAGSDATNFCPVQRVLDVAKCSRIGGLGRKDQVIGYAKEKQAKHGAKNAVTSDEDEDEDE